MFPRMHTLHFEAVPDAAPLGGGDEGGGESWAPDRETWEQMVETNTMLREALEASQQEPQPLEQNGQAPPEIPDHYADPEGFAAWIQSQVQEQTAPVTAYQQQIMQEEGREMALDKLADMEANEGEFIVPDVSREYAYEMADRHYPEMVARFGDTPKAVDAALAAGYKEAKDRELAIGKAYHEREINQLATLSGAPRELAAAGAQGAAQTTIPQGGTEREVVNRFFPR